MKRISFLLLALFLSTVLPAASEDANYWLVQTKSDYQNGSDILALQDIDEYLAVKPDDTWALSFKANLLLKMNRYSEAVDSFDELIQIDPGNAQAYNDRALVLSGGMRRHDEALASLYQAIAINPNDANYWFNKGMILEVMDDNSGALEAYGQATVLNPSLDMAWHRQGLILKEQGSLNESLSSFGQAAETNPENADAYNQMGLVLMDLGRATEAESSFESALAIEPTSREFQENLDAAREALEPGPVAERTLQFNSST